MERGMRIWIAVSMCLATMVSAELRPVDLRCEQLRGPLGLDTSQPRLSWRFAEGTALVRGEGQTAYEIRVAGTMADLAAGRNLVWQSGRVASDESNLVAYGGPPAQPFAWYYWQVRVWDRAGQVSPWSEAAHWSMGPLGPEGWAGARWIGLPEDVYAASRAAVPVDLKGTSWIWTDEGSPREQAPGGVRYFRRAFRCAGDAESAALALTADNEVEVFLNGTRVSASKDWKTARVIEVADSLHKGMNVLAARVVNHAGPNSPAGLVGRLAIQGKDGGSTQIDTGSDWRWSKTEETGWTGADFDDSGWAAAVVMGGYGCAPWHQVRLESGGSTQTVPSPLLRREFAVEGTVSRATVTVCGLGYYEFRINGEKVGDQALAPRFTNYAKRVLYNTFDVTEQVRSGANALGLMLGNGFYNQHARAAWDMDRASWRAMPCTILVLRLEKSDGTVETVVTDGDWQAATGPYVYDCIRNGVVYDPTRLPDGWDRPAFAAAEDWRHAGIRPAPKGALVADRGLPIRITREFSPVTVVRKGEGRWLFDGGLNIAGWVRVRVVGKPGGKVTLRYRELLKPDGGLDDRNRQHTYSGPFQADTFLLTGGEQVLEPRFVYHGFRHVEIAGDIEPPKIEDLKVCVVGTEFELAGEFSCSNDLLNRIQDANLRAYRSNFVGMPTDCPHREKNGWTGDAQLAVETGLFNYAGAPAYAVWMEDMADCQKANGDFPGIVPTGSWGYGIGPAWDAAFFVIPAHLREYVGDERVLTDRYERMKLYLDFVGKRSPDHIVKFGLGDWCPPKGGSQGHRCPRDLTGTAYYAVFARMTAQVAGLLGRTDEQAQYERLARTVTDAFNRQFLDRETGTYTGDTQTSLACALFQRLVPDDMRDRVFARLVADVEAHDRHIDCGILGTKYTLNVLTDRGRSDLAYAMATQTDFPSWGLWIKQGATTLWENWNGAASHNHVMFGDISAWCYKALAGIRPNAECPGFRRFTLQPDVVGDLTEVSAWHRCPYGRIVSEWRRDGDRFAWHVVVPPGTVADASVPAAAAEAVREGATPVAKAAGIRVVGMVAGRLRLELASGDYRFTSQLAGQ